jgi:hypothetical protein
VAELLVSSIAEISGGQMIGLLLSRSWFSRFERCLAASQHDSVCPLPRGVDTSITHTITGIGTLDACLQDEADAKHADPYTSNRILRAKLRVIRKADEALDKE